MNSERDPIVRLLRQSLPALEAELPVDACLDADVVAAWSEGTLTPSERVQAESHAAGCSRCQAILSSMVRIEPASPRRAWWAQFSMVRWLVPLTAVAALALWIAVPRHTNPPVQATLAQREIEEVQIPNQPAAPRPRETDASAGKRKLGDESRAAVAAPERTASGGMTSRKNELRRDEPKDAKSLDALASPSELTRAEPAPAQAPPSPPAAAPAPPPAAVGGVTAGAPSPSSITLQSSAVADKSAARETALNESVTPAGRVSGFAAGRAGAPGPFDIMSPNPAVRWRLGGTGTVQRSTDSGATWTTQQTGTTAPVSAGWSPAPMVCWLVGRAGTVLLSTDGATWQLRSFPEGVDLVSVRATDAKNANVTTVDGRRFSTADGGVTWSPPQESPAAPF